MNYKCNFTEKENEMLKSLNKSTFHGSVLLKWTNIKGFSGFTLAEVLITLVIVGVIAAMTIPTLINKTNNQEYVSRLKKTYSTLAQATKQIISDEGLPRADMGGWATSHEAIYNMYKKYLSNAKECNVGETCFAPIDYKKYNTNTSANWDIGNKTNLGRLVLADGTFVDFQFNSDSCTSKTCALLHVDVNGQKGPNMFGKDAFRFYLGEEGLFPSGCDYNKDNCLTKNNGTGTACTCTVLREGAINY